MTSTTSYHNNWEQFRQTYLWSMKKNLGMTALLALLLFLANPLILLISMPKWLANVAQEDQLTDAQKLESISQSYTSLASRVAPVLATAIVLLFCAVLCINLFGYMQKKRSVDLYHALPVGRIPMLLGRWCAGLTALFAPILFSFVFTQVVGMSYGVSVTQGVPSPLIQMLWVMLMGASAFTFCMFMMVCTGTTLDAVLSALGLNGGYPLLILCVFTVAEMVVPGMDANIGSHLMLLTAFSPFSAAFVAVLQDGSVPSFFLPWWILMTALFLAGAILLYRRRRSESAEDNFAFPLPKIMVRFLLTAVGGLGFGLMLSETAESGFFIGILAGSIATHVIVEAAYSRGFKHLKKSFAWYGIFIIAFVAFYGVLCTGLFGYDTRVPDASQVESVSFSTSSYWTGTGNELIYNEDSQRIATLVPTVKNEENIKTVIGLQQELIQKYRTQYPYRLKKNLGNGITISYHLKDGSVFTRAYKSYSDDMDLEELLEPVYSKLQGMKEFVETSDLIFYMQPKDILGIDVYNDKMDNKTFALPSTQAAEQLQEALKQDYMDGKVNQPYAWQESEDDDDDSIEIQLNFCDNIVPQESLKKLLNGYEGKINVYSGDYQLDSSSATRKLLKQWGWI